MLRQTPLRNSSPITTNFLMLLPLLMQLSKWQKKMEWGGGIWKFPLKDEEASTKTTSGSSGASLWLTTHSTMSSFGSQMWQHPTEQGKSFSLGEMAGSQSCSRLLVQSNRDTSKLLEGEAAQTDQRQTSPSVCNHMCCLLWEGAKANGKQQLRQTPAMRT